MKAKHFIISLLLFMSHFLSAQDMKEGFNFLENGKYKQAILFFADILKDYWKWFRLFRCYERPKPYIRREERKKRENKKTTKRVRLKMCVPQYIFVYNALLDYTLCCNKRYLCTAYKAKEATWIESYINSRSILR